MGNCALVVQSKFQSVSPKPNVDDSGIVTRNNSSEFQKEPAQRRLTQNVIKENLDQDIREYYDIDDQPVLGSGISGKVTMCVHKTTQIRYALKSLTKVDLPCEKLARLRNELSCMAHLDHPNIIRVHEVFENENTIFLVMELCKGGNLMDRLFAQQGRYYREKIACKYIHSILTAVTYCHANNVVHRDLKLENILFETEGRDSELKLIDFGLSQCFKPREVMHKYVGTSYYVAPEVIDGNYDSKCDVWSVGVIAYMLLSGIPPFYGTTDSETLVSIKTGSWQFDEYLFNSVSPDAKDFISKCLTKRPFWRPTAAAALRHKWFRTLKPRTQPLPSAMIIRRFGTFIIRSTLAKIFMGVVAHTLLPEQIADLRDQFNKFDVSRSGSITVADLRSIMRQFKGFREDYLGIIVSSLDLDQTGRIGYHEFLAATIRRQHVAEENLQLAFEIISNHGECIRCEDVKALLGNTKYDMLQIMEEVGLTMDAQITFHDFKAIMTGQDEGNCFLDDCDDVM